MTHLTSFLEWLRDEGKDIKTIKAYQTNIIQFIIWYKETIGVVEPAQVKPIEVKEYLSFLRHRENRAQATINKATAALKAYFKYLHQNKHIQDNPMTRIKIQKTQRSMENKGVMKWLTRQEQERFISYAELEKNEFKRLRNLAIIDLMLYAGLGVHEVSALKNTDINIKDNIEITIREGKQGKYDTVVLIDKHGKNLRKWAKYRQGLDKYADSPFLFVSERSGQITDRGIQSMIDKYAKLACMEQISCHRFRHSFCKNLANAGVSIQTIADLARHESIDITRIYVENSQAERIKALEKV